MVFLAGEQVEEGVEDVVRVTCCVNSVSSVVCALLRDSEELSCGFTIVKFGATDENADYCIPFRGFVCRSC